MIWFKHFTDNHRGRTIQFLFDELGHSGVACYYLLLELCFEKLQKNRGQPVGNEDLIFTIPERIVRQNLRISPKNLRNFLEKSQENSLFSHEISGNFLKIDLSNLSNLLDPELKKPRHNRGQSRTKPLPETDKETETDKDVEREGKLNRPAAPSAKPIPAPLHPLAEIWNENCGHLSRVKVSNKNRDRKCAAIFKSLEKEEWVGVIRRISQSDFCNGINDTGWVATFDWILQSDVYLKVMEGKYDNRRSASKTGFKNFDERPASESGNFEQLNREFDEEQRRKKSGI